MRFGSVSLDFAAVDPLDDDGINLSLGVALSFEPVLTLADRADAMRLREALTQAFAAAAGAAPLAERDVATINSHASDDPPFLRLGRDGNAARIAIDPIRASLAALARDAIETISRDASRLRVCDAVDCGHVFLDRSRGKRRRWCSMQGCGNRAKVGAFRARGR